MPAGTPAQRRQNTADKAYAVEARLNALINSLSGAVGSGGPAITSATPSGIPGMSLNITPGNWAFWWWLQVTSDNGTGISGYLSLGGSATVSGMLGFLTVIGNNQPTTMKVQTTFNSNTPCSFSLANAGSVQYLAEMKGYLVCTGAGTCGLDGATSGGDGFTPGNYGLIRAWQD